MWRRQRRSLSGWPSNAAVHYGSLRPMYEGLQFFGSRSICHLRLVAATDDRPRVVIATDLEDAPGASIVNDFEALVRSVSSEFGEASTRWLLHFPERDEAGEGTWTEGGLAGDGQPVWRSITREEAEEISDIDLARFEQEPATVANLAGENQLLHDLAREPEPERLPSELFRVVSISALPFPHGVFRCPQAARFKEIAALYDHRGGTVVGAHWFLTLTDEDFAQCPYHDCDWRLVAETSVRVLEALPPQATHDDLLAARKAQTLPERETEGLYSLFSHPIDWTPDSSTLANGQHRSCALRAAGAETCAVDTSGYPTDESDASPRAVAGAILAAYWAQRAAEY
jgi:hypothetical protein